LAHLGLPSRLPYGTIASQQRLFEDPARPTGVRDYHSGDSLRRINWKVSARQQQPRRQDPTTGHLPGYLILLNLNQDEYSPAHGIVRRNGRLKWRRQLAAHLIERKQAVGLATNGSDPLRQLASSAPDALPFDEVTGRLLLPTMERIVLCCSRFPFRPGRGGRI
jgi:hypothetical protein